MVRRSRWRWSLNQDEMMSLACDAEERAPTQKNHWGWSVFTTQDLAHCRLMARIVALIYN